MGFLDRFRRPAASARRGVLRGAAQRIDIRSSSDARKGGKGIGKPSERQRRAWRYFDRIGIIKAPYILAADVSSRVRLFPAITIDPEDEPVPVAAAVGEGGIPGLTQGMVDVIEANFARLFEGGDRGELLRASVLNLRVPGEFVLLGEEVDGRDRFGILSTSQLAKRGNIWIVKESPSDKGRELDPDTTVLGRVWRRHGEFGRVADSNLLSLEEECEELLLLRQGNRAIAQSRIANAGVFFVSNDISFGVYGRGRGGPGDTGGDDDLDPFTEMFGEAMVAPIANPDDPSAVVPIVVRADGELDGRLGQVKFDRPLTEATAARTQQLILDIARGIEAPPEFALGLGDTSTYANARQIVRENYTAYIDPPILLAAEGFADVWLRPACLDPEFGLPEDIVRQLLIWRDPSSVIVDPDRFDRASGLAKGGELSGESWRDAGGFGDDDAPTEEERRAFQERNTRPQSGQPGGSGDNPNDGDDTESAGRERIVALSAAATARDETNRRLDRLGLTLGSIDADLLTRLTVAADGAMDSALTLAGARLRTSASRSAFRDRIPRGTQARAVPAALGRSAIEILCGAAGTDPLFEDAFDDLASNYDEWVRRAQAAAAAAVLGLAPEDYDEGGFSARQEDDRDAGWSVLLAGLTGLASTLLFDASVPEPAGEFDATLSVPPGEIREALAIAGGSAGGETTATGGVFLEGGEPPGGVATGRRIEDLARDALRAEFTGWTWHHGGGGTTGVFPPHEDLDGEEFTSWTAEVLAWDPGEFPYVEHLHPGDHLYCSCSFSPTIRSTA